MKKILKHIYLTEGITASNFKSELSSDQMTSL